MIFLCAKSLLRFILSDCCLCSSEQSELSLAEYINTLKLQTALKEVCEEGCSILKVFLPGLPVSLVLGHAEQL